MKIEAFGVELLIDELAFDEFPSEVQRQQILFVTTLVDIDANWLPIDLPKIYTSEVLKQQLKALCLSHEKQLDDANFHVLKPFEAERIKVDDGTDFEVLACMPADMSTGLMLAFREVQNLRITHLYVGFATHLSSMICNTRFAAWLKESGDSVDNFYRLNVRHGRCVDCEVKHAFDDVQRKLADTQIAKLLVHLPLLGCEAFISELASRYRGIIAIDGLLGDLFAKLPGAKMQHFIKDFAEAVIIVSMNDLPLARDCPFEVFKKTFKVKWLPLPDAFELNLLTRLVAPKSVKVIDNQKILQTFEIRLTKYSFAEDDTDDTGTSNDNTTEPTICHCSDVKTPFQLVPVNHSDIMDCMRHLTIAFTTMPSASNTPERTTATTVPEAANFDNQKLQRKQNQMPTLATARTTQPTITDEQPTSSRASMELNKPTGSTAVKQTPQSKSIPINKVVYHVGKKGVRFEDSSESSD